MVKQGGLLSLFNRAYPTERMTRPKCGTADTQGTPLSEAESGIRRLGI
jgi:hypothetical protein